MRKILYHPMREWLFVKRWALHHETIIIEYFCNLGCVTKQIYKTEGLRFHDYIAKNHKQLVRDAKGRFKKTKKLEVC